MTDIYFWRQFMVVFCVMLHSASDGISMAFPGVMNSSILSPNTTDVRATPSEASWIASAPGFGCFAGLLMSSFLLQTAGRRATQATLLAFDIVSWSILPFATSITIIFLARVFRGFGEGLYIPGIIISEYSDPKRRGYFLTMKKLSAAIGTLICHTASIFYTWRQIPFFAIVFLVTSIILTFFWKESPAYCAFKERFMECERNFIWFYGNSKDKRDELEHLMAAQIARLDKDRNKKETKLKTIIKTFRKKDFFKALLVSTLAILILDLCGRYYYLSYMKQIFLIIIHNDSVAAYCSIVNDVISIIGITISCFVIRYFKRRTILFGFGSLAVALMFLISLSNSLIAKHNVGLHTNWLLPSLLILLNFVVCISILPVNFALAVEIFPLEYRGLSSFVAGYIMNIFYIFSLKLTPMSLDILGLSGTYGIFGLGIVICLATLYFVVPETKDKTLQEIDDEVKNLNRSFIELRPILLKEKLENI